MNPQKPTVLIPLVDLGAGGNDTFLEIYSTRKHDADADKKAWNMALDPVVAPLFPFTLYTMGLSALSRVRKYGLRKPLAAFYQKFNPQAALNQQRLHCATPIATKIEGESDELDIQQTYKPQIQALQAHNIYPLPSPTLQAAIQACKLLATS